MPKATGTCVECDSTHLWIYLVCSTSYFAKCLDCNTNALYHSEA